MRANKGWGQFIAKVVAFAIAGCTGIGGVGAKSLSPNFSDIWWNPSESGWGVQLVHTGTFIFATVFVYGQDGKPTWVTGELESSVPPGLSDPAPVSFSGPLYVTTGLYFGVPFSVPANARPAGEMTFTPSTLNTVTGANSGQLTYSVDGVSVTKAIERQPLTLDNYSGTYQGLWAAEFTDCTDPARNSSRSLWNLEFSITQNGPSIAMSMTESDGRKCTYNGTYSQMGRMGLVQMEYTCPSGDVGTGTFFEMSIRPHIVSGRLLGHSTSRGCNMSGDFTMIDPN